MKIACALLVLAAASLPLRAQESAQESDPLKSPACGAALARLQAARAADSTSAEAVEAVRSAAATACLGSGSPPSRPGRVLQAPVAIPPTQIELPQHVAPFPAPTALPPPVAIDRPAAPALCDAAGCWADDGTHLRQVPPTSLFGPRGLCTQRAGQLFCP